MGGRGRGAFVAVVVMAASACAGTASETEPLPLQESGLVVEDDVRDDATLVAEYAVTEEQLNEIEEACDDAEAVPLEAGAACVRLMELRFRDCSTPFEFCVRVYDVDSVEASYAGWAEVVEADEGSRCGDGPKPVCLRVGLSPDALKVVEPSPTQPTTTSPSPTETSPTTGTPSPTPSETTPSGEPSDQTTSP